MTDLLCAMIDFHGKIKQIIVLAENYGLEEIVEKYKALNRDNWDAMQKVLEWSRESE